MKARIKGTDMAISVEAIYSDDGLRIEKFVNIRNEDLFMPNSIDIIPGDTDWEAVRIQAAIAAMQGFLSRQTYRADLATLAKDSVKLADALIAELQEDRKC